MNDFHLGNFVGAVVYAALGIFIFAAAFWIIDRMTPYHLWTEIVHDKNLALAVLLGAMSIGICIIIAAAVH
jgi:uncharacterized membrane protein YjfL (UPF0719 family)